MLLTRNLAEFRRLAGAFKVQTIVQLQPLLRGVDVRCAVLKAVLIFFSGANVETFLVSFLRLDRFSLHHGSKVFLLYLTGNSLDSRLSVAII